MNIYIWSGRTIPQFDDFYSKGLYVASGNTKEEAVSKLADKNYVDRYKQIIDIIAHQEKRIKELDNGAKSQWSPGVEKNNLNNSLLNLKKKTEKDCRENEKRDREYFTKKLLDPKNEPEVVRIEDLAVYEEAVG
jgi:predicted RNA-binding protein Jag